MKSIKSILTTSLLTASAAISAFSFGASADSQDSFNWTTVESTGWTVFMFNNYDTAKKGIVHIQNKNNTQPMTIDFYCANGNMHRYAYDVTNSGNYTVVNEPYSRTGYWTWDAMCTKKWKSTRIKGYWELKNN